MFGINLNGKVTFSFKINGNIKNIYMTINFDKCKSSLETKISQITQIIIRNPIIKCKNDKHRSWNPKIQREIKKIGLHHL